MKLSHPTYDDRMKRVTVTMPDATYKEVREAVHSGVAPNVSAFVTDAAEAHLQISSMSDLLDELDAKFGPPSDEDFAWARDVLDR